MRKLFVILLICGFCSPAFADKLTVQQVDHMISEAIRGHVLKLHEDWNGSDIKVYFKYADSTFRELTERKGKVSFSVADIYSSFDPVGDVYIPIQVSLNGAGKEIVYVRARVEVWKEIVVTGERIGKKDVISSDDVALARRDVGLLQSKYFEKLEDVVGKQALSLIPAGNVVQDWMLRVPPDVEKSEEIIIVAEMPTLKATARGVALEDGYEGDSIKVQNLDTKKELRAEVVGSGKVRVEL